MADTADWLYERLLVLRCQAGDEAALAELMTRYQPRLRYYLRKLLRDMSQAEDALQEVWLSVYRALPKLADVGAFRAWVYRIARDRALRELRKHRQLFQPLEEIELTDERAEEATYSAEEAQLVHAALDELSPEHREVLVLRYVEAMSYEEIARIVTCQVGTVRSRLHYAKRSLRDVIERMNRHD